MMENCVFGVCAVGPSSGTEAPESHLIEGITLESSETEPRKRCPAGAAFGQPRRCAGDIPVASQARPTVDAPGAVLGHRPAPAGDRPRLRPDDQRDTHLIGTELVLTLCGYTSTELALTLLCEYCERRFKITNSGTLLVLFTLCSDMCGRVQDASAR